MVWNTHTVLSMDLKSRARPWRAWKILSWINSKVMCKPTQTGVLCSLLLVLKPPFSHIPAVSICSRTDFYYFFFIFSCSSVFVYLLIHLFVWTLCSVLYFFHPHLEIPRGICDQLIGRIRLQKLFHLYFLWPCKNRVWQYCLSPKSVS